MRNFPALWNRNTFDLFDEMNRFFEQNADASSSGRDLSFGSLAADFHEDEGHFLLSLDIPGMKKEDLKIEIQDNILTISGERKRNEDDSNKNRFARRSERSYGFFQRSFTLPTSIDAGKVEAQYEDGVLQLMIPKAEAAKARRIEVQSGKGGFLTPLAHPEAKRSEATPQKSTH